MVTQSTEVTSRLTVQTDAPTGDDIVGIIGVRESAATVSANVAGKYYRGQDADTDFGDGSDIADAVITVRANGANPPLAVAAGARSGSPFTETFGASGGGGAITTGTLNTARLPIRKKDVTAAARDGVSILAGVKFTSKAPATLTPTAAEVYINPKTGAFKLGTATTGTGAGFVITYASYDWAAAFDALFEYGAFGVLVIANTPFNADNYGVYDAMATEAAAEDIVLVGALASAVVPGDVDGPDFDVTDLTGDHIFLVAANGYTGDLGSAMAARVSREPPNATFKDQLAPTQSVTYTSGYTRAQFGDDVSPATGTFHQMGVNAIYRDPTGVFRISSARARVGYSDNAKFIFRRRVIFAVAKGLQARLRAFRESTSTGIPYDDTGIAGVRSQIGGKLAEYVNKKWISADPTIDIPALADISDTDKANAVLNDITVNIRLPGQIHTFSIFLDASLA